MIRQTMNTKSDIVSIDRTIFNVEKKTN